MITKEVRNKFIEIVGESNFDLSDVCRAAYAYDSSPTEISMPLGVISPRNTAEVSAVVKICNENRIPIVTRGAATNLSAGTQPNTDSLVMLVRNMDKVLEIDEENLTITVQPGVVTVDIHSLVESKGLFYPPDPGSMKTSTIGGNIAENAGGLRGLKYGITSSYVMGLEVVLANGDVIRTGGKLAKDVAGYNLTQLMVGSEGTLGIITEATLKLIPKPEYKKTMLTMFQDMEQAAQAVSKIIANKIIPVTLEFMDKPTIQAVEDYVKIGLPTDVEALLVIEQDGDKEVVERDIAKIVEICKAEGANEVKVAANAEEATQLFYARRTALSALARLAPTTVLEDATVPRSEVAKMVKAINEIANDYGVKICTFGHAGDGNLHPTAPTDIRNQEEMHRVEEAFVAIFEKAIELGGTITGEHGVGTMKAPYLKMKVGDAGIVAMKAIKRGLDPNNILNPGKVIDITKEGAEY